MAKVISSKETADLLGVHDVTLKRWRVEGKGPPFVRLGRSIRYRLSEVERWLAERESHENGNGNGSTW